MHYKYEYKTCFGKGAEESLAGKQTPIDSLAELLRDLQPVTALLDTILLLSRLDTVYIALWSRCPNRWNIEQIEMHLIRLPLT